MSLVLTEAAELARRLDVSLEAVALARDAELIDLHLDTFIPVRLWGYDVRLRHGPGLFRGMAFGHLDIPRALDAGLAGGMWSITTNPFRSPEARWKVFQRNLARLLEVVESSAGYLRLVRTTREHREARAAGAHSVFVAVQGGNCFDAAPLPQGLPKALTRVTLVHLTSSQVGTTSTWPLSLLRKQKGLTSKGMELVKHLDHQRIFVDLAHIHPDGFWDAVKVHDRSLPLIDTHTGVAGVTPHWRNLDDRQLRAIADTGGTIGIIFSSNFLGGAHGFRDERMVMEHVAYVVEHIGEDFVSIGSDFDGAIIPPRGLRSGDSYPRLVQQMLNRGWSDARIRKILGGNFLRALSALRPD